MRSSTRARIGVGVGVVSVAFSTLCCLIVGVFTPAFMLAALVGTVAGVVALALHARRTALVTFTFGLAPLFEFLLLEWDVLERVLNAPVVFVVFAPLALAIVVAVWAVLDYLREGRAVLPDTAARGRGREGSNA